MLYMEDLNIKVFKQYFCMMYAHTPKYLILAEEVVRMFFTEMPIYKRRKDQCALPNKEQKINQVFPKRISLGASLSRKRGNYGGSLTIEAACILPLFLYAVLALMYFFAAIRISGAVSAGILETGKELAVYAYAKEFLSSGEISGMGGFVAGSFSQAYAKSKIEKKLEDIGVDTKVIKNGTTGVSLLESSFLKEEEMIDLVVRYRLKFPIAFFTLQEIPIVQRGRIRAWTGRDPGQHAKGEGEKEGAKVYVTVNGSVYHKDKNCTHIRLSVKKTDKSHISQLRNQEGAKYYPCEICKGGHGTEVYITDTGNRYHDAVSCSGLKRQVLEVPMSQVEDWRPCSRCGG